MKKIIDLIAPSGAKKDEKLINYIRKKHIKIAVTIHSP